MNFIENHSMRTFNAGDTIFHEDDPGKSMFIIRNGMVDVAVRSGNKQVVIATLTEGAIFGEMALIDSRPRSASVIARTKTVCVEISQMMFQKRMDDLPSWMQSFYHILVDRLRESDKQIGSAVTKDTGRQIMIMLAILNRQNGENVHGMNALLWKETVEEVSTVLNIPHEYVEKVLNKLTLTPLARSEINYGGRKFIIEDPGEFEAFTNYCKNKSLEKLGFGSESDSLGYTQREQELLDLLNKLVKEQAGAPDLEEYNFKSRCKTDLGKLFEEVQPEFDALVRRGIIKPRRDEDGHKFYDVNIEVIKKIEEQTGRADYYEALEAKLK
ncbi:MAG: cyclic nucleotide-binding domain-containing protein [Candidatus Neomarinimicrobiota bacterium]